MQELGMGKLISSSFVSILDSRHLSFLQLLMFKSTGLGFPSVRTHVLPLSPLLTCHQAFKGLTASTLTSHILFLPQMNKCQLNVQMKTANTYALFGQHDFILKTKLTLFSDLLKVSYNLGKYICHLISKRRSLTMINFYPIKNRTLMI